MGLGPLMTYRSKNNEHCRFCSLHLAQSSVICLFIDGKQTKKPVTSNEAKRDLEQEKSELHMTFLPKTAQSGHEILNFVIALPLTLLATGFLFFIIETGSRALGA